MALERRKHELGTEWPWGVAEWHKNMVGSLQDLSEARFAQLGTMKESAVR